MTQEQNHDAIILTIPDSKRVNFAGSVGEYGTMILVFIHVVTKILVVD